jgi:hypothetical protein
MKKKPTNVGDRLGGYLTAVVSVGTLAGTADAAIVNIDISAFDGPNANLPTGGFLPMALVPGNPMNWYNVSPFDGSTGVAAQWNGPLNLAMKADGFGLFKFATGATIGAAANWASDFNSYTYFNYAGIKQPDWGSGSFIGFQANSNSTPLYGWLEVTWDSQNNIFEFLSGAYEDSGASILAGAGAVSVIPEPSSALATIGLLAGGMMIRRRKQAA